MVRLTHEDLRHELLQFRKGLKVPAVFGGVVHTNGDLKLDVVGTRRRGHSDMAMLTDAVHIGSCLKMLTATLFGTYITDRKTDWNMPVSDAFPDLEQDIDPGWRTRPIWELLYCIGGMDANPPRRILTSGYSDPRPPTEQRTDLIRQALAKPPSRPGKFVYSNLSYVTIGGAIDRLSGTSFEAALKERILAPLDVVSAGYGPPENVWGHRSKLTIGPMTLLRGKPADPARPESDNPPVLSSAGTLHLTCEDWAKLLRLFQRDTDFGVVKRSIIERVLTMPNSKSAQMAMGWAPAKLDGVSYGAQGSNTLWAATALMDTKRERTSFVVCNDGRSTVLAQSAFLAAKLLERDGR